MDEKLAEKVVRLTKELEEANSQIANCNHNFLSPVAEKRKRLEPVFSHYEGKGSDPEPIYNYSERIENGWIRECRLCGYSEYTAKTKPVVRGYEPDFCGAGGVSR